MRLLASLLVVCLPASAGWPRVFESLGLDPAEVVVLEGASEAARGAGFVPGSEMVLVRGVRDRLNPALEIVWEKPLELPRYRVPAEATVFTRERWTGAPLAAGFRRTGQVVFWTIAPLGDRGYERFPYIPQALAELGVRPRLAGRSLWAFFDSSYRLRSDLDYLAERWRRGGIAALHVAAWHYWEPDAERDGFLNQLIVACHRQAILVYAWVELPHVSERFWQEHPGWREQTATGQDAHLDWRKLMNLSQPECAAAVAAGLAGLAGRFDWDGINLGELYFESLEGYSNPARFTPFSAEVREEFRRGNGFDPTELYERNSKRFHKRDAAPMRKFLDFRAELAGRLQQEWLGRLSRIREAKPWLDLVLTHIDDRFDTTMRDKLGADAARLLPVAARHGATFLIEDPATVWNLGPERYDEMARRYGLITTPQSRLAVDINVVERYQDVYPTKQQTGAELFQLVHRAARAFPRVALYFENSILSQDWPLLAAAAAPARSVAWSAGALEVDTPQMLSVAWPGCASVNGAEWAAGRPGSVLLPAGRSKLTACESAGRQPRLLDFNGTLLGLRVEQGQLRIEYESPARAIAILPGEPERVVLLPPGRHSTLLGP